MGSRDILPFAVTRFDQRTCNLISLLGHKGLTRGVPRTKRPRIAVKFIEDVPFELSF